MFTGHPRTVCPQFRIGLTSLTAPRFFKNLWIPELFHVLDTITLSSSCQSSNTILHATLPSAELLLGNKMIQATMATCRHYQSLSILQQNMVQTAVLPSVTLGLNHSYNVHYCNKKGSFDTHH